MKKIVFLIVVSIAFIACKKEEASLSMLRIKNETPYQFDNVYVKIGESENNYGPLNPNETSGYKGYERTSYPYIKVSMEGEEVEFQIQPTEAPPVGEHDSNEVTPPSTCVIQVNEATNKLGLYFIR
jgi:uncharacterized protein YxeA